LVWVGSALALVAAAVLGLSQLAGVERALLIAAAAVYVAAVQLPTAIVNVPLNNALQKLEPSAMDAAARQLARRAFEPTWNRWNGIRTVAAVVVSALLLLLVTRL
jgi:uncharacterized membrane protein